MKSTRINVVRAITVDEAQRNSANPIARKAKIVHDCRPPEAWKDGSEARPSLFGEFNRNRLGDARMAIRSLWIMFGCLIILQLGCGESSNPPPAAIPGTSQISNSDSSSGSASGMPVELQADQVSSQSPARVALEPVDPEVEIVTSKGTFRVILFAQAAPRTVDNFLVNYVGRQVFDETIVHYIESDYMMALGGFDKSYQPIDTRAPILNEADNGLKNVVGTLAMARMHDYAHSAMSQFFVNLADQPSLDYRETEDGSINGYCVFGKVIAGMDVIERIAQVATEDRVFGEVGFTHTPKEQVIIQSIRRIK